MGKAVEEMILSETKLPWPELSEDEKKVVDANYKALEGRMG